MPSCRSIFFQRRFLLLSKGGWRSGVARPLYRVGNRFEYLRDRGKSFAPFRAAAIRGVRLNRPRPVWLAFVARSRPVNLASDAPNRFSVSWRTVRGRRFLATRAKSSPGATDNSNPARSNGCGGGTVFQSQAQNHR